MFILVHCFHVILLDIFINHIIEIILWKPQNFPWVKIAQLAWDLFTIRPDYVTYNIYSLYCLNIENFYFSFPLLKCVSLSLSYKFYFYYFVYLRWWSVVITVLWLKKRIIIIKLHQGSTIFLRCCSEDLSFCKQG